jgi:hypothetical protein
MNGRFRLMVVSVLVASSQIGLASTFVTASVAMPIGNVPHSAGAGLVIEVPFTIDTSEIRGGSYLYGPHGGSFGFNLHELGGQTSGTFRLNGLAENSIIKITLGGPDGDIIAQDLYIPRVKTTLVFNVKTAALTDIVNAGEAYGATADEQVAIYQRAENHTLFSELETIYRKAKGWPTDDTISERAGKLEVKIAFDLIDEIRGTQE